MRFNVNILILSRPHIFQQFPNGSKSALDQWQRCEKNGTAKAECARQNKSKPGGAWHGESYGADITLANHTVHMDWPFMMLYHRVEYHTKGVITADGKEEYQTEDGRGHFETMGTPLSHDGLADTFARKQTLHRLISPVGPTAAMHSHLCRISHRIQAAQYQTMATLTMTEYYNRDSTVVTYKPNNAVGVRVSANSKGGMRRKIKGCHNVPGIIIAVHPVGTGSGGTEQPQQYTVLTEFGVLKNTWKVDELVPLSVNSFPELMNVLASFTDLELLATSHPDHKPVDKSRYDEISIEEAWDKYLAKRTKAPQAKSQSSKAVGPRVAAVAAETAIAGSQSMHHANAPQSGSVATPEHKQHQDDGPSHIVEIVGRLKTKYKVRWSYPPNTFTAELQSWMQRSHPKMVEEYELAHPVQPPQQVDLTNS